MMEMPETRGSPGPAENPQAKLARLGFEMALEGGLGALSTRSLGGRVGASQSTMNYHFGSRERFLVAVQHCAMAQSQSWRAAHATSPAAAPLWANTADVFLAALQDRLTAQRQLQVLLFEFAAEAEAMPALFEGAQAEAAADDQFWRSLAVNSGATVMEAPHWADFALGIRLNFVSEANPAMRSLWLSGSLRRLDERINRRRPASIAWHDREDAAAVLAADAPRSETARKIVQAALEVIGKNGAAHLSQREVAAKAGVSLALVTYFYRTKADLIIAAFSALHRDIRSDVLQGTAAAASWQGFGAQIFDAEGRLKWRLRAFCELMILAARDPTLSPIAEDIRRTRGATSMSLLQQHATIEADPLDAFLWSVISRGVMERLRFLPAAERRPAFDDAITSHLATVFKAP